MDEVTTVELGGDRDGQAQPPHRGLGNGPVRHRGDKVAAKGDEHLGAPGEQDVQGVGLVAFVDDHRVLGKRARGTVGRELAQCALVETG